MELSLTASRQEQGQVLPRKRYGNRDLGRPRADEAGQEELSTLAQEAQPEGSKAHSRRLKKKDTVWHWAKGLGSLGVEGRAMGQMRCVFCEIPALDCACISSHRK